MPRCARQAARRSGGVHARVPSLRGVLQSGRDCAHDLADVGFAAHDCWNGVRQATRIAIAAQTSSATAGRCGSGLFLPLPR